MELLGFYFVRFLIFFLNTLPYRLRFSVVRFIVYLTSLVVPSFDKVSLKNIRLVFPDADEEEVHNILKYSRQSFVRFILDCARFDMLGDDWYRNHIKAGFNEEYHAIRARNPGKGILVASGHMGSIEFQAYVAPICGRKFSFIARPFKNKRLNDWWNARREKLGNQVIGRSGAVTKVIENLNNGIDVAILIDQNITRKHAVFVDWFGRPGATTFALGLAAVETKAPIVISAIVHRGQEQYEVLESECDVSAILGDESLSKEQKILAVTDKISQEYQKVIRLNPSEWFWMHRRWKTAPEGMKEDFYSNL